MPNKKLILPIFLIVAVDILGLTIVIPFLPFYVEKFGASPFMVGLVMSSYALFQLLASPILGVLSDRYGRKPILVISQIGTLIGFIILARAQALSKLFCRAHRQPRFFHSAEFVKVSSHLAQHLKMKLANNF
jgi:MFS family permease